MHFTSQILSVNKNYLTTESYQLGIENRAFRYGDGFFETMHANGREIQFVDDHWERIEKASQILKLELPDFFSLEFLKHQVAGLLSRQKLFQAARVKLMVVRETNGFYIPDSNQSQVIIEASYLGKGPYELTNKSLIIGLFEEISKPNSPIFTIKSLNALPYILAGVFARQNQWGDAILVDSKGFLVESTSSNLFLVSGKKLITPSLETGCVKGIMRKQVIKMAEKIGYSVGEDALLTREDLLEADEVFLTNAIAGIRSVTAFDKRRYFKKNATKLLAELNREAFASLTPD